MMRRGDSDSTIDFYQSSFCKEVLDAAHATRFAKEQITYGSDIFDGFRGDIWPANTLEEITEGGRLIGGKRIPLAKLADGSRPYGRIIHNMLRPFGRRGWKDHYLATYPDDKPVGFTICDFDRHPPRGLDEPLSTESDEWLSIDEAFWQQVSTFHDLAKRLDIDVMWIQSPGRWLVDGHHLPCRMFGLYAIIRHSPKKPSQLRPLIAASMERVGLNVETSWYTRNRNIRIPGQCFMEVCRVDPSRRSIVPIRDAAVTGERERNMARLAATVDAYEGLNRKGGERLLGLGERLLSVQGKERPLSIHRKKGPPEAAEGLVTSPIGNGVSPSDGPDGAEQGESVIPRLGIGLTASLIRRTAIGKPGSTSARKHRAGSDNTDASRWRREPDTFRTLHNSGLLRRALREYGWEAALAGEAVWWMAQSFRVLRPSSSATCSDDKTLASFLRKHYLWGCKTYDPAKAKASARLRARMADQARIAPSLRLADRVLDIYLKGVAGLSEDELRSLRRFRTLERRHAGRIACRTLYAAFGGQRRYMAFQTRHGLLHIAQEHSQSVGRCRQWTLAPRVIRSVRMLMDSPALLFMIRGEGARSRKRVIYSETHRYNPQRRRRISAVHLAWEARHARRPVNATPATRGPPPEALKTRENALFSMSCRATIARRHRGKIIAA